MRVTVWDGDVQVGDYQEVKYVYDFNAYWSLIRDDGIDIVTHMPNRKLITLEASDAG